MDLFSSIITGYSFISQIFSDISDIKGYIDNKKLEKMTAEINYEIVEADLIKYAEAADEYIQKKHGRIDEVISNEERTQFISDFYRYNPNEIIYKFYIDRFLNSYLDMLQSKLCKTLTSGEKYIVKQMKSVDRKIDQFKAEIRNEMEPINNSFQKLLEKAEREKESLKKYYNGFKRRFEEIPDEEKQELIGNSNFAHRFSLCTLKIQYWQLFSYLNSYAMLLEAVSSVKQVPCS